MILRHSGRVLCALSAAALFCLALAGEALAQKRVFARVEPNADEAEEDIRFDVNVDPFDNIAPNIVLNPDGTRGFVSYTGSGTVLVFSPVTGGILARIKTGGRPAFATPLPGNRNLAVVSVLDTRIFMIDMEANELTATYSFPNVQFGFGSIVSASPDGSTGYISSTGTGEILRFSLADGAELGRLGGMQAPAQITLSHDGATLMVVDTLTEELVFVDAAALTRKSALKGSDPAINFTLFNRAVLSPDGSRGIIASRDVNGFLAGDTVIHFRTSTGEILETATIGAEPGFTTLTPDGRHWVIFNQFSVTVINTEDFGDRRDQQTVQGEPLGSANIVFSPDSKFAFYASASTDLVFQHDLTTGAVVNQVLVGDRPNEFLDQPSTMAMTPDGKIIAVVTFVSNNIELLADAWVLDAAKFISSAERFTGLTLLNLGADAATFSIIALNNFGEVVSGEGIENPVDLTLQPNQQISRTVAEIFKFDDAQERVGWLAVFSDRPDVAGYVSTGDTSLARLDGAPLFREVLRDFIVPEVVRKEGRFAELNLVNPNFNQGTFETRRILRDGTQQEVRTGQVAFPTNRQPQIFGEQFIEPEEVTDGYLRVTAPMGVLMTEVFGGDGAIGALNAIDMDRFAGVKKVFSPQFAVIPGYKTILNVINGSGEDAEITITLHGPDGEIIGQPLKRSVVRDEQIKDDLAELFKDDPEVRNVTGWIEVESTHDKVVGAVTFTNDSESFLTGFALSATPMTDFLFPVVAEDATYLTGMALLNPDEEPATVTVELWGLEGNMERSNSLTLAPKSRTALYLRDYFPNLEPRLGGNLRVHSTRPLYGFSLINDQSFTFFTALPPLPLP